MLSQAVRRSETFAALSVRLSPADVRALLGCWRVQARADQLPPPEPWRTWVFLGGRGAGKTRAGAEWVRARVEQYGARRVALLGATYRDVREVMVEGPSGLTAIGKARFEPSRGRVVWPNGAVGYAFTAEQPERLRGPQFDTLWADEFAAWANPEALTLARLGLRLGRDPKLMVTTTPIPSEALKRLLADPGARATRAPMARNRIHLAPGFVAEAEARWGGTAFGRQELVGVLLSELPGALWRREEIEACRMSERPMLSRVVVGLDPPVSSGPSADACGIVAAGLFGADHPRAIVLSDDSVQGLRPEGWAAKAAAVAERWAASAIVAEANQGGELVRSVLRAAGTGVPVRLVRAREGKAARAQPVRTLYAQGRVLHLGRFPALEDEMCSFGAPDFAHSPDRLDALVWALTDLLLSGAQGAPRVRAL